ncbi:MAG: hypothetical protein J2P57_20820, partial [Acidimicrobiaceae bacterium]|nr:hypothetical protein [Acidimicrobiaceae bacterium]
PEGDTGVGEVMGRSGFVAIQGHQAERSAWTGHSPPPGRVQRAPLPAGLVEHPPRLDDRDGRGPLWVWDFAYLVALEDRQATSMAGLSSADSLAAVDPGRNDLVWSRPARPELRDRLLALAERWQSLGRPSLTNWQSTFVPLAADPPIVTEPVWVIDRIDFRQIVTLP